MLSMCPHNQYAEWAYPVKNLCYSAHWYSNLNICTTHAKQDEMPTVLLKGSLVSYEWSMDIHPRPLNDSLTFPNGCPDVLDLAMRFTERV